MNEREPGLALRPFQRIIEEFPHPTVEMIRQGSSEDCIRVAWGVELGKCAPIGYDTAAQFMRDGRETYHIPAHDVWLMAEAKRSGREEEAREEFPDSPRLAAYLFRHMRKNPVESRRLDHIRLEIEALPDYKKPRGVVKELVGRAAVRLARWADS